MFGIDMGPSGQENQQYNLLNSSSQFATGLGEGNLTLSSEFFRNLLTDPTKALSPEISAGQTMVQNQAKTNAEFGNRGGGTNAATQASSATNRGNIINAMTQAQTGAAGELSSSGSNLLSTGMSGTESAFGEAKTMQDQRAAMWNDIIKSAVAVGAAPFTGGASLSSLGSTGTGGGGGGFGKMGVPDWLSNLLNGGGGSDGATNPAADWGVAPGMSA